MAASLVLLRHGRSVANDGDRFGGWLDDPLSPAGVDEALAAGDTMKGWGIRFGRAYSSVLVRAVDTLRHGLRAMAQLDTPTAADWRLNERHYGALQGLRRTDAQARYGAQAVRAWRRGFHDVPPPLVDGGAGDSRLDARYAGLGRAQVPLAESLAMTRDRVAACWHERIVPDLAAGRHVLVVAHGNSLRALMMIAEGLSEQAVVGVEVPHAQPIVYRWQPGIDDAGERR